MSSKTVLFLAVFSIIFPAFTFASFAEPRDELFAIYAKQSPVVAVDRTKHIYLAWQSVGNSTNNEILLQKFDSKMRPLWPSPLSVFHTSEAVRSLSLDTDEQGSLYVSWIGSEDGSRREAVSLQKINSNGVWAWGDPIFIATARDSQKEVLSLSEVQVDRNGNAFFLMSRRDFQTGVTDLIYQVVNSEGYVLWQEGKKLSLEKSFVLNEKMDVDLELNKERSIAYISWAGERRDGIEKTLFLQKINYDGNVQWHTNYRIPVPNDFSLIQFPGIEMDEKENIFLGYATTREDIRYRTVLNWRRINRFGHTLWEGNYLSNVHPERFINSIALEAAGDGKVFFLLNSKDVIQIMAFQPDLSPTVPDQFRQMHREIVSKPMSRETYQQQGQTDKASMIRLSENTLVIAWNLYEVDFFRNDVGSVELDRTYNEMVLVNRLSAMTLSPLRDDAYRFEVRNFSSGDSSRNRLEENREPVVSKRQSYPLQLPISIKF
jgi:hypothetical protein